MSPLEPLPLLPTADGDNGAQPVGWCDSVSGACTVPNTIATEQKDI